MQSLTSAPLRKLYINALSCTGDSWSSGTVTATLLSHLSSMIAQVTDVSEAGKVLILRNVRVFDGTGFTKSRSVVIKDDRIGNCDPEGASETVDCKGLFLIPGLIDAHVHLHNEGHLQALASHGITTALDMAMWPAEKMNGLRRKTGLPDIRSAGLPVTAPGSLHSCMLPLLNEVLLSNPEQADLFVQRRIEEGSDYIKIISDVPGPTKKLLMLCLQPRIAEIWWLRHMLPR